MDDVLRPSIVVGTTWSARQWHLHPRTTNQARLPLMLDLFLPRTSIFVLGIGMLYGDFESHFAGNQLTLAAGDLINLLALRGVKSKIELNEWKFSGTTSAEEFATAITTWLKQTFPGHFQSVWYMNNIVSIIKTGARDPIAKIAHDCVTTLFPEIDDLKFEANAVARVRITDAFWCELHHMRRIGCL